MAGFCVPTGYVHVVEIIRAKGLEIAYERVGSGAPLVFVHGAVLDSRLWQPQVASLADEFTVVAWDEPGAGRSSDVPAGFALTDYADCLAAVIESLGLGPAHVAGLSWGGTLALELYRRRPGLVATLILIDTYTGWKGSLPRRRCGPESTACAGGSQLHGMSSIPHRRDCSLPDHRPRSSPCSRRWRPMSDPTARERSCS